MRQVASVFAAILSTATVMFAQTPAPSTTTDPAIPTPPPVAAPSSTSNQTTPPPAPDPAPAPAPNPPTPPRPPFNPVSSGGTGTYERRDALPSVNLYLPDGQASVRIRKLIKNVLFESQIDYKFVDGDISTFLRYKYYAKHFTYRISLFDSLGFPQVGSNSAQEFERTRGGLLLLELPRDYNNRYFLLLQDDRLTFGDLTRTDNRKNNIYTKIGYQYGTQFDERLNGIVGESRGRLTPVLTAFREIGPQKLGFAAAVTEAAKISTGDYKYTKVEGEALRRFDITGTSFFVARLHGGLFLTRDKIKCVPAPVVGAPEVCGDAIQPIDRYSIPRYEMFQLGGRDAMKGVHANLAGTGTHEFHETNEYFVPIFRNRDMRTWLLHWNNMYGIGYLGAGTIGFDYHGLFNSQHFAADAGLGSEMSLTVRDYDVLLSVIYARTIHAPAGIKGSRVLFSIKTSR
ncbi:MAG: hypothetical protein ABI837_18490 [Acidobacteriota bacterium]